MTRLHVGLEMSHYNKYIDSDKQLRKNNEEVQLAMLGIPRLLIKLSLYVYDKNF